MISQMFGWKIFPLKFGKHCNFLIILCLFINKFLLFLFKKKCIAKGHGVLSFPHSYRKKTKSRQLKKVDLVMV